MTTAKERTKVKPEGRSLTYALFLSLAIHALHITALPLIVTFDSHLYYKLSTLPGSGHFFSEFDYLRTPLFPLILRGAFGLLGERPETVLVVNACFSLISIMALSAVVKALAGTRAAVFCILALSLWPLSIVYQHSFLSESGSACMFSLVAWSLFHFIRKPQVKTCLLVCGVLTTAYYFRPTFLYMAPCCSLLALALVLAKAGAAARRSFRFLLGAAVLMTAVPMLLSAPWRAKAEESGRMSDVYVFGMINQALLPPEDAENLGNAQLAYAQALERAMNEGHLDVGGMLDSDLYAVLGKLPERTRRGGGAIFANAVIASPIRYAKGVVRSMLLFLGVRAYESENTLFSTLALAGDEHSVIFPGPEQLREVVVAKFGKGPAPSFVQRFEEKLNTVTTGKMLWLLNLFAALLLLVALVRRNVGLAILPGLIFAFYGLHAMTLMSIDRYAFPGYFLLIASAVVFLARAFRWIVAPVVVEKEHPIVEKNDRLRALLEEEAMKELREEGNDSELRGSRRRPAM